MPSVWIDSDSFPKELREFVIKMTLRHKVPVILVSNQYIKVAHTPLLKAIRVGHHFDAADAYIIDNVEKGDLVLTSDIPLAEKIVKKGATGISSRGEQFDEKNVGEALAMRNLSQELRSGGYISGGPKPFNTLDKKKFTDSFDKILTQLVKKIPISTGLPPSNE